MAASPQAYSSSHHLEALEPTPPGAPLIHSSTRIPALDGLRGIAILLVLLCHAVFESHPDSRLLSQLLVAGRLTWSGVDLFFVLSGFLIGGILLDAKNSPRYFQTFYIRRAFRILPLYGVVVALFLLRFVTSAGPLGAFSRSPVPWWSYVTFTQNFWMGALGTFGVGVMAATWSLAVEEQFYVTAPFVVRKLKTSSLIPLLVSVVLAAPLLRTALHLFFRNGNFADYVLMPCRADALCLGVLSAILVRRPKTWKFLLARRKALSWGTGFLFAGLFAFTFERDALSTLMVTVGYSWLALFYTGVLMLAVTAQSGLLPRVLRNRSLMQLGGIAYGTYLIHLPAMEACRRILGLAFNYSSETTQFAGALIGVGLTLALANLSFHFFERPLLRLGQAFKY